MSRTGAPEIELILSKLERIDKRRRRLRPGDATGREALLREEHRVQNRLTELQDGEARDKAGTAKERAAAQTDITRTPRLPETRGDR